MKTLFRPSLLVLAIAGLAARPGYSQTTPATPTPGTTTPPGTPSPAAATPGTTTPAATSTPAQEAKNAVGVTQGVPLPTGLSYFADNDNYHNLTVGVQAGLGASEKSATFGYDNLAVSTRWKLGNNALGKRLHFLAGFSDWRIPAYRNVFRASLIDSLPKQDRYGAQSTTAASLGLSFSLGREDPTKTFGNQLIRDSIEFLTQRIIDTTRTALTPTVRRRLLAAARKHHVPISEQQLDTWTRRVPTTAEQADIEKLELGYTRDKTQDWVASTTSSIDLDSLRNQRRRLVLQSVKQQQDKGWGFSTGALFRLAGFTTETDVQAYDLFATLAKGVGIVDIAVAGHYLRYLDNTLPKQALTGAAGVYASLDNNSPTPVLGLTASYGRYTFHDLHEVFSDLPPRDRHPRTDRFDLVLSYSGAPDKQGQTAAGVGIRYARIMPSLLPAYNLFSVVFSTNFSLIK